MKTSFAAITSLLLGASMAYAAFEPSATRAPQHKRQSINQGLDLSAILANPSSYLKSVSSQFKDPKYASEFSKATANPKFEKSISRELVSQFGSVTASIALQQYTAILGNAAAADSKNTASASSGSDNDAAVASSSTLASATATATGTSSSATSTSALQQVSGAHSGASTTITITFVGSAITLGAAVVLAAL